MQNNRRLGFIGFLGFLGFLGMRPGEEKLLLECSEEKWFMPIQNSAKTGDLSVMARVSTGRTWTRI